MSETITTGVVGNTVRKNSYRVVGIIAERLGVKPAEGPRTDGIFVSGAEYIPVFGGMPEPVYSLTEVAVALLDRLDAVAALKEKSPTAS